MNTIISKLADRFANKGELYYQGEKVTPDYQKAFRYFRIGSFLGDAYSAFRLGYMCENGQGCTQDFRKALEQYKKAAERGDLDSYVCVGDLYKEGKLGKANTEKAILWYHAAAAKGHAFGAMKEQLLKEEIKSNQKNR